MNVDLRVHLSFVLLLIISVGFSFFENGGALRGVALWLAMCSAVLVREVARSIAATYVGLRLRALFLLPIGGLMAFSTSSQSGSTPEANTRLLMLTGPDRELHASACCCWAPAMVWSRTSRCWRSPGSPPATSCAAWCGCRSFSAW